MRILLVLLVGAYNASPDTIRTGVDARDDDAGLDDAAPDGDAGVDAPGPDAAVSPPPSCASLPPVGWTRRTTTTNAAQSAPQVFEDVHWVSPSSARWTPFPNGGAPGKIATDHGEYIALRFTTPTDIAYWNSVSPSKSVSWVASQVDGEATLSDVYVTLSRCPGDFRVHTVDSIAPANDPTFAPGCTSFRRSGFPNPFPHSNVNYTIGTEPSAVVNCTLAPGQTYYLNFIRANVSGGSVRPPASEITSGYASNCNTVDPVRTFCGVQMTVN